MRCEVDSKIRAELSAKLDAMAREMDGGKIQALKAMSAELDARARRLFEAAGFTYTREGLDAIRGVKTFEGERQPIATRSGVIRDDEVLSGAKLVIEEIPGGLKGLFQCVPSPRQEGDDPDLLYGCFVADVVPDVKR